MPKRGNSKFWLPRLFIFKSNFFQEIKENFDRLGKCIHSVSQRLLINAIRYLNLVQTLNFF